MLRFIKQHMASIDGIEIYPLISLVVFVLFFSGLLFWVFRSNKQQMDTMSNYPLQIND